MNYTEVYIEALEPDVKYLASKYHIDGYECCDLEQELRIQLFRKLAKYDPHYGTSPRTWATIVMTNRLRDLARRENRRNAILRRTECDNWEIVPYNELDFLESLILFEENSLNIWDYL
jgi:RNA polymerase sigma factor (sigma-70 family)